MDSHSFSKVADEHANAMPEPSEHAIASELEDNAARKLHVDDHGTPFDPLSHSTDSAGDPIKGKNGAFRKRRGRKSQLNIQPGLTQPASSVDESDTYRQSAEATIDSLIAISCMMGGEEFAPRQIIDNGSKKVVIDERENGVRAFERYYRHKNMVDIPPGIALCFWFAGYYGSRMSQSPSVRFRMKTGFSWLKDKLNFSKRAREKAEKKANA